MNRSRIVVAALVSLPFLTPASPARGQENLDEARKLAEQSLNFEKDKKYDQAVKAMRKVIELVPGKDDLVIRTSNLERLAQQYDEGLKHALEAIKLNDKVPVYYVLAAANAWGSHDLERAREFVKKARDKAGDQLDGGNKLLLQLIEEVTTERVYTIRWTQRPGKGVAQGGVLLAALPTDKLPYQSVTFEVTGAQSQRYERAEANDLLRVVPFGNRTYELTTKITCRPYSFKKDLANAAKGPAPREAQPYLGSSEFINPKSPKLVQIAADLKADTMPATVRNIIAWLQANIKYEVKQTSIATLDFKTLDEIVDRGHAECRGYSMLFVALCRAADVPARPVWGLTKLPGNEKMPKGDLSSHTWCEVYANGGGWVPVDPQTPETFGLLPTSHIRIFMDERKSKTSQENLPVVNLVVMNGEKVKWEAEP